MYLVERLAAEQTRRHFEPQLLAVRRSAAARLRRTIADHVGPEEAGDEPYLIARRCPQAVVAVGADRYALGQWVLSRLPVDCFVLDDGFQHVQLHRDVNLLLVDATDLDGLGAGLPVGRLREPLSAAARASVVLITRVRRSSDAEPVWRRLHAACPTLLPPVCVGFPQRTSDGSGRTSAQHSAHSAAGPPSSSAGSAMRRRFAPSWPDWA
ncbi:MAG: tetraacyldisaccharide 4'-kinase [Nitrospira sp.]|nr:tetraacyldisaccharide 4'-kinase [Nitrospira sp.]